MRNKLAWFKALPFWLAFRLLALSLVRKIFKLPVAFSFSQGVEDLIAEYYLPTENSGTYVDVGCNEAVRYSNTFGLYLRGWRGINIDANSELIEKAKRIRKQDISIRAAVSDSEREVIFHKAKSAHEVSTIDEERLAEWKKLWEFDEADQEKVVTRTLTSILNEHLRSDKIDLLSIDVEGHDYEALKGLDLTRWRPKVIIIEIHDLESVQQNEIYKYLTTNSYSLKAFAVLSAFFVDNNFQKAHI